MRPNPALDILKADIAALADPAFHPARLSQARAPGSLETLAKSASAAAAPFHRAQLRDKADLFADCRARLKTLATAGADAHQLGQLEVILNRLAPRLFGAVPAIRS